MAEASLATTQIELCHVLGKTLAEFAPEGNDFCNLSSSKVDVILLPHKPLFRSDLGRLYQVAIDQLLGIVHELLLEQRARWARDFIAMLVDYILQHENKKNIL